jgi:hypothetical protein
MRLVVMLVTLVLALGVAPVFAQETEQPRPLDSLSQREIEREQQQQRWQGPSGFWTSPHASKHGAYRYRLLLIGVGLVVITGLVTLRLVKRASAERAARTRATGG